MTFSYKTNLKSYLVTGTDCHGQKFSQIAVAEAPHQVPGMVREVVHHKKPLLIYAMNMPLGRGLADQELVLTFHPDKF